MTAPDRLTDTELNAFVDGELDERDLARIEAMLAKNPEDAARVASYRTQNAALHDNFDAVANEPVPKDIVDLVMSAPDPAIQRPQRSALMQIAASIVLLLAGAAGGWGLHDLYGKAGINNAPRYVERAVSAHLVYTAEKRHAVEVAANVERNLVKWLSKRLGHPQRVPSLVGIGYQLVGGRLLEDAGRPAAHFMYQDDAGRRLTVYVRAYDGPETEFKFVGADGVSAFYWIDAPFAYALTGELPRTELLNVANVIYKELAL